MDKKFVIFLLVSVGVLYFSNYFFNSSKHPVQPVTREAAIIPTPVITNSIQPVDSKENKQTIYENDSIKATFSSFGAKMDDYQLKKLNKEVVSIDISNNFGDFNSYCLNFDLNGKDTALDSKNWNISSDNRFLNFDTSVENLHINKKFFMGNDYYGNSQITFINQSDHKALLHNIKLHFGLSQNSKNSQYHQVVIFSNGAITRIKPSKKDESKTFDLKSGWVGIRDQYFCYIMKSNDFNSVTVNNNVNQTVDLFISFNDVNLEAKNNVNYQINLYLGPQNYTELKKSASNFNKIVDFGFFNIIGVGMLYCLKFFYNLTQNYGFSIILLTILIRALLWWPTQKSYTSMKKMQTAMNKMQPRLKTLKEIYRDNPQKLNEETMKLYKEYQINPMGGCLPMLLQMPIFFALYATLNSAVELKGARFFWVWKDLSLKDPIYALPILMGLTMFFQQKMSTPPAATAEAEAQQKMMLYLMPAMLTFFAFMWPAGLLLYWVISNLISIFQQLIINRKS
jgi:YidC/Oxa1 family membrane protein insertase